MEGKLKTICELMIRYVLSYYVLLVARLTYTYIFYYSLK